MDDILRGFLEHQLEEAGALAARSELLELESLGGSLPDRYVAHYTCRGLVRPRGSEIVEAERFAVGIWFPGDYLRRANPLEVVTWLSPQDAFHPNIGPGRSGDRTLFCIGHLSKGTPLVDILTQCFEIITYQKVTMREDDALNAAACAWARVNQDRFPIDRRTLLGRVVETGELATRRDEAGR